MLIFQYPVKLFNLIIIEKIFYQNNRQSDNLLLIVFKKYLPDFHNFFVFMSHGAFRNNEPQLIYSVCVNFCFTAKQFNCTYIYVVFYITVHYGFIWETGIQFPVLYSGTLLFTHSIYTRLLQVTPNLHSLTPSIPSNHKAVFYVCESFLLCR